MREIESILTALTGAPEQRAALATLVTVEGSSYRRPGARLLLLESGPRLGSISGGCLEEDIVLRARRVLATGTPELAVYDTTEENDLVWGVGLGCQGVVRILVERIDAQRPPWLGVLASNLQARRDTHLQVHYTGAPASAWGTRLAASDHLPDARASSLSSGCVSEVIKPRPLLYVFGAGDDAQPLVRLADQVGWASTVIDSRGAYATAARFPAARALLVTPAETLSSQLPIETGAFAVVMTHRYAEDVHLLRHLLIAPLDYLGVLGPRKRTERILAALADEGLAPSAAQKEKLFAPVGLDLGSTVPETIALAILAEMQAVRARRAPQHLRERTAPIHAAP